MREVLKDLILLSFFTLGIFLRLFEIQNISFLWNIALALLVYFSAVNISFDRLNHHMEHGLKLLVMSFLVNMLFLSLSVYYVLGIKDIMLCLFFSAVTSGIAVNSHKIMGNEAILSPLFSVLIPIFLLEFMSMESLDLFNIVGVFYPFFQTMFIAVGSGIIFAILGTFIGKSVNIGHHFTAMALYFFAEFLNSNGAIAVFAFGLFLGNVSQRKHHFSLKYVDYALFAVMGYLIYFHNLLLSFYLFLLFLFLRLVAIEFTFFRENIEDKLDLVFLRKKGSTGIAMALLLGTYILKGRILLEYQSGMIINLIFLFVLFTNITTFIYDSSKRSSSQKAPTTEP